MVNSCQRRTMRFYVWKNGVKNYHIYATISQTTWPVKRFAESERISPGKREQLLPQ